jgi:hypothetical protein
MYPETVGRSLEEVEEIFKQGHTFSAWKIGKDVGKKTLDDVLPKTKELPEVRFPTYPRQKSILNDFHRRRRRMTQLTRGWRMHDSVSFTGCFPQLFLTR